MGVFADRLAAMELRDSSPDGFIDGTLTKAGGVRLSFRDRTYGHYTERGLESQLSGLYTRLREKYLRYRAEALTAATGQPVDVFLRPGRDPDARGHRLHTEHAETVFKGMSPRALVYVESIGLTRWRVVIRDGALAATEEAEFCQETTDAYKAVLADERTTMSALREKHYEH